MNWYNHMLWWVLLTSNRERRQELILTFAYIDLRDVNTECRFTKKCCALKGVYWVQKIHSMDVLHIQFVQYVFAFMLPVKFPVIRPPQLQIQPMTFEVPHTEDRPLFIGREWVFKEIEMVCGEKIKILPSSVLITLLLLGKVWKYKDSSMNMSKVYNQLLFLSI